MIADKFVDLHARNSGLRDKLVSERDVVLTYALRALYDAGVMDHLAFKGGTCLRKLVFGSAGRFSEDLDFTLDSDRRDDSERIEPSEIIASVEDRLGVLRRLTQLEQRVIADARSGWNEPLADRLRVEIRKLADAG